MQAPCLVLFHLYFWCHSFAVWIAPSHICIVSPLQSVGTLPSSCTRLQCGLLPLTYVLYHPCKVSALSLLHAFIKVCCLVIPTTSCVCVLTQLSSIHVHFSPSHSSPHTFAIWHSLPSLCTYHHCPISAIFTHTYVSLPFLLMQWGTVTHGWLKQE